VELTRRLARLEVMNGLNPGARRAVDMSDDELIAMIDDPEVTELANRLARATSGNGPEVGDVPALEARFEERLMELLRGHDADLAGEV
jgi:hypothetical protein